MSYFLTRGLASPNAKPSTRPNTMPAASQSGHLTGLLGFVMDLS
jgi:hypothetical protein